MISFRKRKKLVYTSLAKPLQAYKFFKDIISFIRNYWNSRKFLCTGYSIFYFYFYPGEEMDPADCYELSLTIGILPVLNLLQKEKEKR